MNRDTIRDLGFPVEDPIDIERFWDYCPICGGIDKEDGRICRKCKASLNKEIGE